jgi:hypothetical protein
MGVLEKTSRAVNGIGYDQRAVENRNQGTVLVREKVRVERFDCRLLQWHSAAAYYDPVVIFYPPLKNSTRLFGQRSVAAAESGAIFLDEMPV